MLSAHVNDRSAVPWWAAFGAPLVGVPLLVLLLALGSPRKAQSNTTNAVKEYTPTEQVEGKTVQATVEVAPPAKENVAPPRC